jgi:predicted amidophosphoribosyltransferase
MDVAAIERAVDTPMHRVGMDEKARELTVKKAFRVAHPRVVNGKSIVLIDDVLTSGATASACARVLKKNGAARVFVFTLGRAVLFK